ncbi:deoxyuridine triphosphatase, partial [Syncephalis fuscata]
FTVTETHAVALLLYKRLSDKATAPTRATQHSVGYDLSSATDCTIQPSQRVRIPLDLAIEFTNGYMGDIRSRSGRAFKEGLIVITGTIDPDYRGNIYVVLCNISDTPVTIKTGERIAQLVLTPVVTPTAKEIHQLSNTQRGNNGFGSTGQNPLDIK